MQQLSKTETATSSDLTKVNPTSSTLTESLLNAQDGKTIAQASSKEISSLLNELNWKLGVNTARMGEQAAGEHLLRMTAWLVQKHGDTSLKTIRLAYDLAIEGRLDVEVIAQLNPLQLGKVLAAYRQFQGENESVQQRNRNRELFCELPATPDYIDGVMRQAFAAAYQTAQSGDTYPDLGNGLYDWLDQKGLIAFTPEQKWEFFNRAKGDVQQLMSDRLATEKNLNSHQKAPMRRAIKQVMSDAFDAQSINRIRAQAKYLALNKLLADLIDMQVSAADFLDTLNQTEHED